MRWARLGLAVVGLGVLAVAGIGVAHTRVGRPLLALLGRVSGSQARCPLGYGPKSAGDAHAARVRFAATHRGTTSARSTKTCGFVLGSTTRHDVEGALTGMTCAPGRAHDLECAHVTLGGEPLGTLWLDFEEERLVGLVAMRNLRDAETAAASFARVEQSITETAGAPTSREGDATPAALGRGLLAQASVEYRFADYHAVVRVTELARDRFTLIEEHRALPR